MKKIVLILLVIVSVTLFSFQYQGTTRNALYPVINEDTGITTLGMYGFYIFQREGCFNCHQLIETSNPKISLDGLGGKYPYSWHFIHLFDPMLIIANSGMPSFPELFHRELDTLKLQEIDKKNPRQELGIDTLPLFIRISNETALISEELKRDMIERPRLEKMEIIALLSFLQQIPPSPAKRETDDLIAEGNRMNEVNFKALIRDNNSEFMKTARSNNIDTIRKGGAIFMRSCSPCHQENGSGNIGPNLTDEYWLNGNNIPDIALTIWNGINAMPSWKNQYSTHDISLLTSFVRSLKGTKSPNPKAPQGKKE